MNCFGAFFGFLAYGFSSFLGLSAYCFSQFPCVFLPTVLSGLLCFFSNCFSGFLGFLACRFKSVLDRLPAFFAPCFTSSSAPSCPKRGKSRGRDQRNNKTRYFHDCLLFICCPCTKKTDETTRAARIIAYHADNSGCAFAARTFVNGREFRQWDAENIKHCDQSVSQSQTHRSNCFIAPRARQDPFSAAYHATVTPKQAKKFHVLH